MDIVKFSSLKHSLDNSGVLTIFVDNDKVLKISPMDLLKIARDVMAQTFKAMCIPDGVSNMIPTELQENERVIEDNEPKKEKIFPLTMPEPESNIVIVQNEAAPDQPELNENVNSAPIIEPIFDPNLLIFIRSYVNNDNPANVFYLEEVREFTGDSVSVDDIVAYLKSNEFLVTQKNDKLYISQGVRRNDGDHQRKTIGDLIKD